VRYLNGHGFLRGFAEASAEWICRGRRFFCSNRHQKAGCGRTCSVLLAELIAGFIVTAWTLFRFLRSVGDGLSRKAAWEQEAAGALSLRSGYRLWKRLSGALVSLRTALVGLRAPPEGSSALPEAQLALHAAACFPEADCPFSTLQLVSQGGLFG